MKLVAVGADKALPYKTTYKPSGFNEMQFHHLHDSYKSYDMTRPLTYQVNILRCLYSLFFFI